MTVEILVKGLRDEGDETSCVEVDRYEGDAYAFLEVYDGSRADGTTESAVVVLTLKQVRKLIAALELAAEELDKGRK